MPTCFPFFVRTKKSSKVVDDKDDLISGLQNRMEILENKIDSNADGKISYEEMANYFRSIITSIPDKDGDGVVTKSELISYIEKKVGPFSGNFAAKTEKLDKKFNKLQDELNVVRGEASNWRKAYNNLHDNFKILENKSLDLSSPSISHVSEDSIKEYVKTHIIDNPEMNFKWIPDGPEAKIWTIMLYRSLQSIDTCLAQAGVDLPGHKLTLAIRPEKMI